MMIGGTTLDARDQKLIYSWAGVLVDLESRQLLAVLCKTAQDDGVEGSTQAQRQGNQSMNAGAKVDMSEVAFKFNPNA